MNSFDTFYGHTSVSQQNVWGTYLHEQFEIQHSVPHIQYILLFSNPSLFVIYGVCITSYDKKIDNSEKL